MHIREKCSIAIQVHETLPANKYSTYTIMPNRQVQTQVQYMHKGPCFITSEQIDWQRNESPFIPIQGSVPAFNCIPFGSTWWEQCALWMQRMGRLSDIFPGLGPVCRFFWFELMFLQTELKFHNVTQSLSQHDKITSLPSVRSQTPPSLCENSSHCRIPVHLFAPSSDEKSNDPHLD